MFKAERSLRKDALPRGIVSHEHPSDEPIEARGSELTRTKFVPHPIIRPMNLALSQLIEKVIAEVAYNS